MSKAIFGTYFYVNNYSLLEIPVEWYLSFLFVLFIVRFSKMQIPRAPSPAAGACFPS